MKWLIIILIVVGLYGNQVAKKHKQEQAYDSSETTTEEFSSPTTEQPSNNGQFKCDGRTHCSNMTSCAEATFFLQNCPGVEMDGNHDGVPCEKQWCN